MSEPEMSTAKASAVINDWIRRPGEGPFTASVVEEDGTRWQVTAEWRDGWLDWRIEARGLGEWGLGRRIFAGYAGG